MHWSTRNFNISPPPPGQTLSIWTFEDWIVHVPAPSGQSGCSNARPYRRIYLSNAPPKEQSLSAPDMSYFKKHNFNIETIKKWLEIELIKSVV